MLTKKEEMFDALNTEMDGHVPVSEVVKAERAIQKILIDLVNRYEVKIDSVEVDTRNFANLSVAINLASYR